MSIRKNSDKPTNTNDYVWVYLPDHPNAMSNGYVYEHRLVMERALGRFLRENEQVQHTDGNPHNNTITNLELWVDDKDGLHKIDYHSQERDDRDRIPEVLRKDYKERKKRREEEATSKKSSLVYRVIKSYLKN
ncbi:hypothetical protein EBS02_02870 [bacterium]|nr:hypothetical protein [bacterium]